MQIRLFLSLILLGMVHFAGAQNCTADFSFTDDGLNVMFHDESVSDPGDPIVSWFWDFDDGVTSTLQNPVHTFPEAEDYQVCLTIETQSGCVSQVCIEVDICTLIISANVSPNCNANGEIEVTITISDPYDAAKDINVSVDGVLVPGSPFEIEDDEPVVLMLFIPGDGLTHTIHAQSIDVGHCNVTYELTTQDCNSNCFLSGLQVQITNTSTHIVEVADNFFNPDNITVFAGDIVEFQWLEGGHSSTSDATSGQDSWNSGILGAGATYPVQITNPGLHPYYCIPHGGPGGVGMSGVIVANCPSGGEFDIEISFQTTTAGPAGYILLIDGVVQPGSPFDYQGTGLNTLMYNIAGDGMTHTFEIEDVADPTCVISYNFVAPDCGAAPTCNITVSATQNGSCNANDNVSYELTVVSVNGGQSGFQVFVDGIQTGGNFNYDLSGTTIISIEVPGDGQSHEISAIDIDDNTCSGSTIVMTQNCAIPCNLTNLTATTGSSNIIPVEVADFEFLPKHVTITSGDIVEFQWTGAVQHTSTSDATSGPNSWDSGLQSVGATFQTPVLSEGVHPYYCIPHGGPGGVGMSGTITVQADCTNGEVAVALTFDAEGTGPAGYNLLVDGNAVPGNPFAYDPSGTNTVVVSVPGDGQSHTIEVQDADDPACSASTAISTPDCNASTCQLTTSAEVTGPCNENENINLQLTVEDVNGGSSGFRVRIDGEITDGSPYLYDPSGTTVVNELLSGDGQQHTILVEDLEDGSCSAGDNILLPDCSLVCQIYELEVIQDQAVKHTIEVRDFEFFPTHLSVSVGDTVEWVWVGDVEHTSTSDATSGPDSWNSGLLEQGASFKVVIETAGVHPYYCIPHGGPGGVGMSGTISAFADCENDLVSVNIRFQTQGTGQTGYWIAVDGETTTQEPLPYDSGMVQNAQILVTGDGMAHTILVTDADDPTCSASIVVETPDCHAVECAIDLSATSIGCNSMGEHAIVLTIDHTSQGNNGFQVVIDGIPYSGSPFDYDTGATTSIDLLLPGDGNLHQVFVYDIDQVSCSDTLQFQSADCDAECTITGFSMDIADNYKHIVEVRDYEFFPKEINVFTGDTVHFVWVGEVPHTSTSDATTGEDVWNSGLLSTGATFEAIIQNPGMHRYYCIPHGGPGGIGMAGVINAKDVCEDGLFPAEICFNAMNGSVGGFNIVLDGSPLNASPLSYNHQGETCYYTLLPGNGISHSVYIEDVDNNKCGLDTIFEFPDCGNICFGFEGDFNTTFNHQTLEVSFIPGLPDSSQVSWDFGDGNSSIETEPVHQYDTAGYYTACLYISNNDGCADTICHEFFVGIFVCTPQFIFENDGLSVEFRDSSLTSIQIEHWIWTFGDGTTSEGHPFPVHQYEELGVYEVCLTIQADSCLATTCKTLDLSSQCLVTTAAFDIEDKGNGKFRFINQSSGNISSYLWGFGDGTVSTGATPTHQYAESGLFTVCLLILDNDNSCSDFTCLDLQVVITGTKDISTGPGQLIIYPNPVSQNHTSLYLFGWQELDIGRACSIHLFSLQGNRIAAWKGRIDQELQLQPGLQLIPGGYFLRVATSERQYLGKLIVQ